MSGQSGTIPGAELKGHLIFYAQKHVHFFSCGLYYSHKKGSYFMKRIIVLFAALFTMAVVVSCAQNQPAAESATKTADSKSQTINQISYDPDTKVLILAFERGTYSFAGVPAKVHDGLLKSDSQGAYYQSEIRGKYKSTKIEK